MKATRRETLKGALAVPALAAVPTAAWARHSGALLVYDPALTGPPAPGARAIEGDRVRFARALFEQRPSLVIGVTRSADALLIEDVAREAGYLPVTPPAGLGSPGWALAPRT